jgi:hypothetical protein
MKKLILILFSTLFTCLSYSQCPGFGCSANCTFTSCSACCSSTSTGGAVCTCTLGFAGCGCVQRPPIEQSPIPMALPVSLLATNFLKSQNEGGAITQSSKQKENLNNYIASLSNVQSTSGKRFLVLIKDISKLFTYASKIENENYKSYSNILDELKNLVTQLSGPDKDMIEQSFLTISQKAEKSK